MEKITEYWVLAVAIGGGIGRLIMWVYSRKKDRAKSSDLLYNQLEQLKTRVILQVAVEVQQATELGEKQKMIDGLKTHCSDCYERYLEFTKNGI